MSNHKDEPSTTEAPADTADIEQELSDEEMGAVAGGVSATLSATSRKLGIGLLLPAVQKIGDGSV